MDHQPYALWSIWRELAYSYRLFIFILGGVSIYSLFLAIRTMLGLRAIRSLGGDVTTARGSLEALSNRFANVRQAIGATFYLFGFVFFVSLQTAFNVLGLSSRPSMVVTAENFILHFIVAANVFFIFLVLHLIQWFVWCRLGSFRNVLDTHRPS